MSEGIKEIPTPDPLTLPPTRDLAPVWHHRRRVALAHVTARGDLPRQPAFGAQPSAAGVLLERVLKHDIHRHACGVHVLALAENAALG